MEITIICILLLVVLAVAVVLVYKVLKLREYVNQTKKEIEQQRYFSMVADVANDHVGIQQLEQITMKAEVATLKAQHLDTFGEVLKPLLQYIITNTKKLADGSLSEEERNVIGRKIEINSTKLTNTIENLLLMARIDSDSITFSEEIIDVDELMTSIFDIFSTSNREQYREVENKGEVTWNMGKGAPMKIKCDRLYLTNALNEVVKNAYQFIEKGNIQLGWFYRMSDNQVEIFVEDNGIGIKDDYQSFVFEPFFKGDENYSGAGIGLYIADSLVKKMGGEFRISSRGDYGTRVSILLPSVKE